MSPTCRKCGDLFESDRKYHRYCWSCYWELRDSGRFDETSARREHAPHQERSRPPLTLDVRLLRDADAVPALVREAAARVTVRPTAQQRLEMPGGVLSRSDLRELGYERRAVDVIFGACEIIQLPGYSRPLIRVTDYLAFLEANTYSDRCGDRVRPT